MVKMSQIGKRHKRKEAHKLDELRENQPYTSNWNYWQRLNKKILKAVGRKWHITYRRTFEWSQRSEDGQTASVKTFQLRTLYSVKLFLRNEGKIKIFSDSGKLREFITSSPAMKEIIWAEGKWCQRETGGFKNEGRAKQT